MSEESGSAGESVSDVSPDESQHLEDPGNAEKKKERKAPKMRQVKINGEVQYIDEDKVFRDYQKYQAGEQKLREASQMRESAEQFYKRLEEDPDAVFRDPKLSAHRRKLAEKWMLEAIEEDSIEVDPRDLRAQELERQLAAYKKRDTDEKEQAELSEREKFVESRKTAISQTLADAMQATHLSAHPESAAATLREMAVYMRAAKERGEDISADELVEHIHNSRFHQMYTLAHQYEGPELIEFLGDEIVNRVLKAQLEKIRASRNMPVQSYRGEENSSRTQSQSRFIDPSDERIALRKR